MEGKPPRSLSPTTVRRLLVIRAEEHHMKRSGMGLILGFLVVGVGCSTVDEQATTLEALGVANVTSADDRFVLEGRDGTPIGEVQLASDATVVSNLHGGEARTHLDGETTIVECNGDRVTFADARVVQPDVGTVLAPCEDALRVASIVLGSRSSVPATPTQNLVSKCLYLGENEYCDGGYLVVNHDWLCDGAVETSTSYLPGWWFSCPAQ
jgi:hypothetical protein